MKIYTALRTTLTVALMFSMPAGPALADEASGPVVARWTGGEARASAVEARLPQAGVGKPAQGESEIDRLVARYGKAAEQEAVAQLILATVEDPEAHLKDLDAEEDFKAVRQNVLLRAYIGDLHDAVDIEEAAIDAYYEEHKDQFAVPGRLALWNIYKRDVDGDKEATNEFLLQLRQRYLDGENFGTLAREYSESETRLRDGRVGSYAQGELPEGLAKVAFSLEDDGISEPQRVSDGAVLLHVTDVVEATTVPREEASGRIESILISRKVEENLRAAVAEMKPPAGSTVLSDEEFLEVSKGDDRERVVLEIGDFRMTAGQAGRALAAIPAPADVEPGEDSEEARNRRLTYGYAGLIARALTFNRLEADPGMLDPLTREDVEEELDRTRKRVIVDGELRKRVRDSVAARTEELKSFYDDNAHHFQSDLRFEIKLLKTPLGDDAMARMRTLEGLREEINAGTTDLATAATKVEGEVEDLGWKTLAELGQTGGKLPTVVLDLGTTGVAVPFQDEEFLQMVQVVTREDPHPLPFEEVKERVIDEFLERRQRKLTAELMEKMLADAKFAFDAEAARAYVLPPAP